MFLLNLSVTNFGVFRGEHLFNLAPLHEKDRQRHLTVFSGHNGAGKTTLFQAMMIAFHGRAYLGDLSMQQYNNFILSRMHRTPDKTRDNDSSVRIDFRYVKSGQYLDIQVERRWRRQGRGLQETLTVLQNGQKPEIDRDDYQTWIDDFISPGFARLCFFDAEQLDTLANVDQQGKVLAETLDRLLGLDLVQRLQIDLEQVISRQGSTAKIDHLYVRMLELRTLVDEVEGQLDYLRQELDEVSSDISSCTSAIAQQERLLAAEGGAYAAKRPVLQNRLIQVKKEVESLSNQLHDLCTDLLPFALAPELCLQLSKRLASEIKIRQQQVIGTLWQEKLPEIEAMLSKDEIWSEIDISLESKRLLTAQLLEKVRTLEGVQIPQEVTIVHHLAEPEQQQLKQWIVQVILAIPQQVQSTGEHLRTLKEEHRRAEMDLQRAPDDAALAPIHAEITRLHEILSTKQKRQTAINEQIGSLQFQYNERLRALQAAIDQYEKARKVEKQLRLAEQSRLVLRTYKDALTHQKLQELEEALTTCFNKICRKENLLSQVYLSPDDFGVRLEGVDDSILNLNSFSAGERQLYALALLWALRLVSHRPLPLAIDTPLARLDEMHRQRLVHDYIPKVSDQVLLFTTDAELDSNLLSEVEPHLARIYRLKHNSELGETTWEVDSMASSQDIDSDVTFEEEVNTYGVI